MRIRLAVVLAVSSALTLLLLVLVRSGAMPLGVRGEWEWQRVPFAPLPIAVVLAGVAILAHAGFAALGMRSLSRGARPWVASTWVVALGVSSVAVQVAAHWGAPVGYGLEKWVISLSQPGSSGYFTVAREEISELGPFLAHYAEWIQGRDSLHIGTHPPGLIVAERVLLESFRESPASARWLVGLAPEAVIQAFRNFQVGKPLSTPEQATLVMTGALTLLVCALTAVPLYLLARRDLSASLAWCVASLWALVPAAVMFQPTSDTAFPLLSTTALALAAWAPRCRPVAGVGLAIASGLTLALGMQFSLVFLAVGLTVGLLLLAERSSPLGARSLLILAVGVGFLSATCAFWVATRANPFEIWWWNQANHRRFYVEYPRGYVAWVIANPIELAVALGVPATVWAVASLQAPRAIPRVSWLTALVLALLTLSGKNLSEVARLWIPFMPALLVAAGAGMREAKSGPRSIAATIVLLGAQTLALEGLIQVVYPI